MTPRGPSIEGGFRPGDLIAGRYRIEARLGEGGFGAVFRATQIPRADGAFANEPGIGVALKLLHRDVLQSEEGRERFRREALLAQRMRHPNVVRLHDFGETDGLPFIVYELLHGRSLDVVLRAEHSLSVARVVRVTTQILKALMEAHALGIVHRDIKPANVFLCDFPGEPDFVKVLDFGVAKAVGVTSMTEMTQTGQIVGTPAYMSPELLRANQATVASDLYALGLTMIRTLSGELAYGGTPAEVIHGQLSPEPVPFSEIVARSPLASIIRRATEKDPTKRFATAQEMLAEIEHVTAKNEAPTAAFRAPASPSPQISEKAATLDGPSAANVQLDAAQREPARPVTFVRLALIAVGVTLLSVVLGIGSAAYLLHRNARTVQPPPTTKNRPPPEEAPASEPSASASASAHDPDDDLPPLDAETIVGRFKKLGWAIWGPPERVTDGTSVLTIFGGTRGLDNVNVSVVEFQSVAEAEQRFRTDLETQTAFGTIRLRTRRTIVVVHSDSVLPKKLDEIAHALAAAP